MKQFALGLVLLAGLPSCAATQSAESGAQSAQSKPAQSKPADTKAAECPDNVTGSRLGNDC